MDWIPPSRCAMFGVFFLKINTNTTNIMQVFGLEFWSCFCSQDLSGVCVVHTHHLGLYKISQKNYEAPSKAVSMSSVDKAVGFPPTTLQSYW